MRSKMFKTRLADTKRSDNNHSSVIGSIDRWQIQRCARPARRNAHTQRGAEIRGFMQMGARFRCRKRTLHTGRRRYGNLHFKNQRRYRTIDGIGCDTTSYRSVRFKSRKLHQVILGFNRAAKNLEPERPRKGADENSTKCSGQNNIQIPAEEFRKRI